MFGEWYLPPGECQVIWTITEGTISISHLAILAARAGLPRTPYPETLSTKDAQLVPRPRSGGLRLDRSPTRGPAGGLPRDRLPLVVRLRRRGSRCPSSGTLRSP